MVEEFLHLSCFTIFTEPIRITHGSQKRCGLYHLLSSLRQPLHFQRSHGC